MKQVVKNWVLYKKEVSCSDVARNVDWKKNVGKKVWWPKL